MSLARLARPCLRTWSGHRWGQPRLIHEVQGHVREPGQSDQWRAVRIVSKGIVRVKREYDTGCETPISELGQKKAKCLHFSFSLAGKTNNQMRILAAKTKKTNRLHSAPWREASQVSETARRATLAVQLTRQLEPCSATTLLLLLVEFVVILVGHGSRVLRVRLWVTSRPTSLAARRRKPSRPRQLQSPVFFPQETSPCASRGAIRVVQGNSCCVRRLSPTLRLAGDCVCTGLVSVYSTLYTSNPSYTHAACPSSHSWASKSYEIISMSLSRPRFCRTIEHQCKLSCR
jgi:hypothetical protein